MQMTAPIPGKKIVTQEMMLATVLGKYPSESVSKLAIIKIAGPASISVNPMMDILFFCSVFTVEISEVFLFALAIYINPFTSII